MTGMMKISNDKLRNITYGGGVFYTVVETLHVETLHVETLHATSLQHTVRRRIQSDSIQYKTKRQ